MGHTPETRARAYQKIRDRKDKWFTDNGPCKWCESQIDLELHHLDPNTKEGHVIWSWSQERINAETAKCIVLCKKCHREYHAKSRRQEHGLSAYTHGRCRCKLCKSLHAKQRAEYRQRTGKR